MRSSLLNRNASSGLVIPAEFRSFLQCLQANVRIVLADSAATISVRSFRLSEQRMSWNKAQLFKHMADFHAFSAHPEIVLFIL
jgi:hypothetical protein